MTQVEYDEMRMASEDADLFSMMHQKGESGGCDTYGYIMRAEDVDELEARRKLHRLVITPEAALIFVAGQSGILCATGNINVYSMLAICTGCMLIEMGRKIPWKVN